MLLFSHISASLFSTRSDTVENEHHEIFFPISSEITLHFRCPPPLISPRFLRFRRQFTQIVCQPMWH